MTCDRSLATDRSSVSTESLLSAATLCQCGQSDEEHLMQRRSGIPRHHVVERQLQTVASCTRTVPAPDDITHTFPDNGEGEGGFSDVHPLDETISSATLSNNALGYPPIPNNTGSSIPTPTQQPVEMPKDMKATKRNPKTQKRKRKLGVPFKCDECEKRYSRVEHLTRHQKNRKPLSL